MSQCITPITIRIIGNGGQAEFTNPNTNTATVFADPQGSWPANGVEIPAGQTYTGTVDANACYMFECGDVVQPVHDLTAGTPVVEPGPYTIGDTPEVTMTFTNTGNQVIDSLTVELVHPDTTPSMLCAQSDFSDPTNIIFAWEHDTFPAGTTQVNMDPRITINGADYDPGPSHVYTTPSGAIVQSWDITQTSWYAGVAKSGTLEAGGFYWYNGNVVLNPIVDTCTNIAYNWT